MLCPDRCYALGWREKGILGKNSKDPVGDRTQDVMITSHVYMCMCFPPVEISVVQMWLTPLPSTPLLPPPLPSPPSTHLRLSSSSSCCIFLASSSSMTATREQGVGVACGRPQGFFFLIGTSEGIRVFTPESMAQLLCTSEHMYIIHEVVTHIFIFLSR